MTTLSLKVQALRTCQTAANIESSTRVKGKIKECFWMVCISILGARESNSTCYLEFYTILILRYQLWQLSGEQKREHILICPILSY